MLRKPPAFSAPKDYYLQGQIYHFSAASSWSPHIWEKVEERPRAGLIQLSQIMTMTEKLGIWDSG